MKIVTLVERGGKSRSIHFPRKGADMRSLLLANVDRMSRLHTDEASFYFGPGLMFAKHETVKHGAGEYARGDVTTNTVEGFFSVFKRGMRGTYQQCGEKHLSPYFAEFDFRYSNRVSLAVHDEQRAEIALRVIVGKRLTYR